MGLTGAWLEEDRLQVSPSIEVQEYGRGSCMSTQSAIGDGVGGILNRCSTLKPRYSSSYLGASISNFHIYVVHTAVGFNCLFVKYEHTLTQFCFVFQNLNYSFLHISRECQPKYESG